MIRSDAASDWILISQVDHARIAFEIAAAWQMPAEFVLEETSLRSAIRDHDDGWTEWEAAPRVDPATGKPRNFLEMPIADATMIWTRSINRCREHSRLGGLWVSRHFCHLAELVRTYRRDNPADLAAAEVFLATQAVLQSQWRTELDKLWDHPQHLNHNIEFGFRCVQFFDSLSLWLCCAERTEPHDLNFFDHTYRLTPQSPTRIALDPYPLQVPELPLSVPARRLPVAFYASDAQLQAALKTSPTESLAWTLAPLSSP